jgi:hypothetical protein
MVSDSKRSEFSPRQLEFIFQRLMKKFFMGDYAQILTTLPVCSSAELDQRLRENVSKSSDDFCAILDFLKYNNVDKCSRFLRGQQKNVGI